jgi:uncharacterized protein
MTTQQSNPVDLEKLIEKLAEDAIPGAAPQWEFNPDECGVFDMSISRDGTWRYQGSIIGRKRMCKLFSTILRKIDDGRFFLVTPTEQGEISVEDAPFVAVEVLSTGEGREQTLTFRSNLDHMVVANAANPIRVAVNPSNGEPSPYVLIRDNLEALILRPQFYQLVELAQEIETDGHTVFGVWSAGTFFELGTL